MGDGDGRDEDVDASEESPLFSPLSPWIKGKERDRNRRRDPAKGKGMSKEIDPEKKTKPEEGSKRRFTTYETTSTMEAGARESHNEKDEMGKAEAPSRAPLPTPSPSHSAASFDKMRKPGRLGRVPSLPLALDAHAAEPLRQPVLTPERLHDVDVGENRITDSSAVSPASVSASIGTGTPRQMLRRERVAQMLMVHGDALPPLVTANRR